MATEDGQLGPANPWFKTGFQNLLTATALNQEIKILPAPCYLASKFEAFKHRGTDYRTSHDIEDIIYILDNRTTIVPEILGSEASVKTFLEQEIQKMAINGSLNEVLMAHIHPLMVAERLPMVQQKINEILGT